MLHNQDAVEDPKEAYRSFDVPEQSQPEPGSDAKLRPMADHGETHYKGTGRLKGRKALITGADSGIGRAVAIAYAREGASLVLTCLPEEMQDAKETLRYCQEAGAATLLHTGDLRSESFCRELANKAAASMDGSVDILVNNASKMLHAPSIEDLRTEQLIDTFTINVFSIFWLTKATLPYMPPGSSVINTTSIQASRPSPMLLDYAASKGAISTLTQALSLQLISRGIRVNAVAPGPIWTPIQVVGWQPEGRLKDLGKRPPYGRLGQPAEVAPAFVYLASNESSFVTGEILGVTGGRHIR